MSIVFIVLTSIIVIFLVVYTIGIKRGSQQQNPDSDLESDDDDDEM